MKTVLWACKPGLERPDPALGGARCRKLVVYVALWEASGF